MPMGMDLSMSGMLAGIIFGGVGLWMFREGKRRTDFRILVLGIVMMMYPYFTTGPKADWGIGVALCGIAYMIW